LAIFGKPLVMQWMVFAVSIPGVVGIANYQSQVKPISVWLAGHANRTVNKAARACRQSTTRYTA